MHTLRLFLISRLRRRGLSARLSPLLMLFHRSSLVKLLPEARIISTAGFTEALSFTATVVGALGAFDAVSGATIVAPVPTPSPLPAQPFPISMTGGNFSVFSWTVSGFTGSLTPGTWIISGQLPKGLVHGDIELSRSSFMSGVPVEVGSFPITLTLWEFNNQSGRSVSSDFSINVAAPPAPAITATGHPVGGNFTEGSLVDLLVTQTSGFDFTWTKDGQPLDTDSTTLVSSTTPRRYRVPTTNPGNTWRSGDTFDDSTWTAVSGGIGYDLDTSPVNFVPLIAPGGSTQTAMSIPNRDTAHIRIPFTLSGNTPISNLKLRVMCDDGFVAWLNGTEIASQNPVGSLAWNSPSGNLANNSQAAQFRDIDVSRSIASLKTTGTNLLAIQAMNYDVDAPGDRDFLFNCELIGGTNEDTHTRRLIIPAINSNQAGSYTLTITNPAGTVTSNPAVLVLPPQIEAHPADVTVASGQTTELSVEAIISPPWTYQWFRGPSGDTSQPVAGATGVSFTTPSLTATTAYWVRVTNSAGSVNSNAATVTVMSGAIPPQVSAGPQSIAIDSGTSTLLSVTATGDAPLSYQWYTGASGTTTGLINGATAATFTTPQLTAPATYWVRVTNPAGSADSATAAITIRDPFQTWTAAQFIPSEQSDPAISGPAADPDGDGTTNEHEYVFGSIPKTPAAPFVPSLTTSGQNVILTFTAVAAAGPGYTGRTRHYAIESTPSLTNGPWTPLPEFTDIVASNQQIVATIPASTTRAYYRLKVSLTP